MREAETEIDRERVRVGAVRGVWVRKRKGS